MIPDIAFPAALAALLLLASCGTQSAKKSQATDQANDGVATLAENPVDAKLLLAAAEEFETIAETSFSADVAAREKMIADAAKAVAEVTGSASPKLRASPHGVAVSNPAPVPCSWAQVCPCGPDHAHLSYRMIDRRG